MQNRFDICQKSFLDRIVPNLTLAGITIAAQQVLAADGGDD